MSSLTNSYAKLTNNGIPIGTIVSDEIHHVYGHAVIQVTVSLSGGTAKISVDNGDGYGTSEDMVEGPSIYDLVNCDFKITLTGSASVAVS